MNHIIYPIALLFMVSCSGQKSAELALQEISQLAGRDSVLEYDDYARITTLHEKHKKAIIKFLQKDSTLLFGYLDEIIGSSYNDMFQYYGDTIAGRKCRDLYERLHQDYFNNSGYARIVSSRLFEAYCHLKEWDKAQQLIEQNLSHTRKPSIDHATLLYSQAWMYGEMGDLTDAETAISIAKEAQYEYEGLISTAESYIKQNKCDEDELATIYNGIEESQAGINDCQNRIFEWTVFWYLDGDLEKNGSDNYIHAYLLHLDSLLTSRQPSITYPTQEGKQRDSVCSSWNHFVKLCKQERYNEAIRYYEDPTINGAITNYLSYTDLAYLLAKNVYLAYYRNRLPSDEFELKTIQVFKQQQELADYAISRGKCQQTGDYPLHYDELQSYLLFAYAEAKLWDQANKQLSQMKTYTIKRYGKDNYPYATILFNQACLYYETGDLDKAIKTMKESHDLYQTYIQNHPDDPQLQFVKNFQTNAEEKLNEWETLN